VYEVQVWLDDVLAHTFFTDDNEGDLAKTIEKARNWADQQPATRRQVVARLIPLL
jgi:hypothetical protein